MNVVLLDDDAVFLDELKRKLAKFNCHLYSYIKLVDVLNSNVIFDVAFIDIELGGVI